MDGIESAGGRADRRGRGVPAAKLPGASSVLAVCAHPDDEAFGLGAALSQFARSGARVSVLCFTEGEASTLGSDGASLRLRRRAELQAAASELGVGEVKLLEYPDGALQAVPLGGLAGEVAATAARVEADLLVVFDEGGITAHPDHERATLAALKGATRLPVLAWCLPQLIAARLESELGAHFVGRDRSQIDFEVTIDRAAQLRAVACHASQSRDNAVLWRRLELLGATEAFRWLRSPGASHDTEAQAG